MKNKSTLKCECGADFYKPHKCPRAGNRIVGEEINCSLADSFMAIFGYKRVKDKSKK
jgi:hypothetical protein